METGRRRRRTGAAAAVKEDCLSMTERSECSRSSDAEPPTALRRRLEEFLEDTDKNARVVIVEIGAGKGVPTVRNRSESFLRHFRNSTLLRINPAVRPSLASFFLTVLPASRLTILSSVHPAPGAGRAQRNDLDPQGREGHAGGA